MRIISDPRRETNNIGEVHRTMEDNAMRTATETWEYDNGGAVEMRDNGDGRQGQWWRQFRTSTLADMQDNRDGYGGGGDAGRQHRICATTEMAKWVGITATDR